MPGSALGTQQAASKLPCCPGSVTLLVPNACCSTCSMSTQLDATPVLLLPLTMCSLGKLTVPYNEQDLVWHPVTRSINNVSYQDLDAWKPVKQANIASFFSKAGSKSSSARKGSNPAENQSHQQQKASSIQDAAEHGSAAGQLKEEGGHIKQEADLRDSAQLEAQADTSEQAAPLASAILNTDDGGGVVESEADVKQEQQHENSVQPPMPLTGKKRTSAAQTPGKAKKAKPAGTQSISNYFSPKKTS